MLQSGSVVRKRTPGEIYRKNAAPPGVNYLTHKHDGCKRFFWWCVIVAGVVYPAYNFNKNFKKYNSYPSSVIPIKDLVNQAPEISFPKVTLCANGIHSMRLIHESYDWLPHSVSEQIYDGDKNETGLGAELMKEVDVWDSERDKMVQKPRMTQAEFDELIDLMKATDFDVFANRTKSQLQIVGCKYLKKFDCEPQAHPKAWSLIHTPFGYCHTLSPAEVYVEMRDQYFAYGRQVELNLISIHNDTDGVGGPFQHYSGLTLFYSDARIESLSRFNSITVAPHDVPIISFTQFHEKKLGGKYSDCYQEGEYELNYYDYYAYEHCIRECFGETILEKCKCVSHSYLKDTAQVIEFKRKNGIEIRRCTLYDQMFCVSNATRNFKEESCTDKKQLAPGMAKVCKKGCKFDRPEAGLIQYGRYKGAASVAAKHTATAPGDGDNTYGLENIIAAVLYLSDLDEITLLESGDYQWATFISNVGGGAGLILGLSVASILGGIDLMLVTICNFIRKLFLKFFCPQKSDPMRDLMKTVERRNSYDAAMGKVYF